LRRDSDVLDAITFGSIAAAAAAAATAIVTSLSFLGAGITVNSPAAPWVLRMLTLCVPFPVLSMAAVGSVSGVLWLRRREPAGALPTLGLQANPVVAVVLALALVIAGAIGATFMAAGTWLAWVIALDVVALSLLRRTIHAG